MEMIIPAHFSKMYGHGNDFIVVRESEDAFPDDWSEKAVRWCRRRTGIGADGLLVVGPGRSADFSMRIFNPDGSEAEMCGNGARCIARFAFEAGIAGSSMKFETPAGVIEATVDGSRAAIRLTDPAGLKGEVVTVGGEQYPLYTINTGVPHAILFTDGVLHLADDLLHERGRAIRFHDAFAPAGTNVDFVEVAGSGRIRVRTYERGVEAETPACGTGAAASALISSLYAEVGAPPIEVQMPGGILSVDFRRSGDRFTDVWLSGDVYWVCRGEILD